jgi:eukaryotic-like serine/threonine-protein kinase
MGRQRGLGSRRIQFGAFELDARAGELRKHNRKIRLQEQPLQILLMLLEQPGEVVLREDIRKRLWPDDTIVEFDHSINAAIKRLRDALDDSAELPQYIETVARRGYRFIGKAESEAQSRSDPGPAIIEESAGEINGRKPEGHRILTGIAITIAVLVAVIVWLIHSRSPEPPALVHLELNLRPADQLVGSSTLRPRNTAFAISPDGRLIVFSAIRGNGPPHLYLRSVDQSEAVEIPGTDDGRAPFFSPQGRWIGFITQREIKKVPVEGGPSVVVNTLAPGRLVFGLRWAEDDTIFFSNPAFGIFKVSSAGGSAIQLTKPDTTRAEWHVLPEVIPGGNALLFTSVTADASDEANVVIQNLQTGARRVLIEGATDARYVSTGHLLYMKSGTLMGQRFDRKTLQLSGGPVALIDDVMQSLNTLHAADESTAGQWALSSAGALVYATGGIHPNPNYSLVWVDRTGSTATIPSSPQISFNSARVSPNGDTIVYDVQRPNRHFDVWTYDLNRGIPTRLTFKGTNLFPIWSPDGKRLVYSSPIDGHLNLYMINADGSGAPERLTITPYDQFPSSWTKHGNLIAFAENHEEGTQIRVLPVDGDRQPKPFLASHVNSFWPTFSPDGHWIAYVSSESGTNEVYVQPYPPSGEKHRISTQVGVEPAWSPDGRELWYRNMNSTKFWSVRITGLNPFRAETPRLAFEAEDYRSTMPVRAWDIVGDRFLLLKSGDPKIKPVTQLEVVLNWTEELKRRIPVN